MLHEPGADVDAWGTLPAQLAQALNVEVVAFDLPGHGLSDDPWDERTTGELVRQLIEELHPALTPNRHPGGARPIAMGEGRSGGGAAQGHRYIVAAGRVASVALALAR
jgi:pimeloyl-ACP methyl ester carboxylesterase